MRLCNFCKIEGKETKAVYDMRTNLGSWGDVCEAHKKSHTSGKLGIGHGQKIDEPSPNICPDCNEMMDEYMGEKMCPNCLI